MAKQSMNFGSNLLLQVEQIRDFFPFWIEPLWCRELVERDLKILRSLGGRCVRFHIVPINYSRDGYAGDAAAKYAELIPFALDTARGLGLKTHLDLHSDNFAGVETADILGRLREFGPERIDTLQIINEYFYLWNHDDNLRKIEGIFEELRRNGFKGELCFDAGGSVHRRMSKDHPSLAKYFRMIPLHHYPHTLLWDQFSSDLLVEFLGGKKRIDTGSLSPQRLAHYQAAMKEHFGGLGRELRLMEVNMAGNHFWAGVAPGARGSLWPEMMRRLAKETKVGTVATWCLRGKMSWREYGISQSGMLYACELPRPEAEIFRSTAMELMPTEDVYSAFEVSVEAEGAAAEVKVINKTGRTVQGRLKLPSGSARKISVGPRGSKILEIPLREFGKADSAVAHLFAEFVPENPGKLEGRCIGWKAVAAPRPVRLAAKPRFDLPGVSYPDGLEAVADFIKDNRGRVAIIVEQPAGPETELAMRLQSAMAEAWGILPVIGCQALGIAELIRDHALIVLGTTGQNSLQRLLGCLLERRYLPGASSPEVRISAHPGLFKRRPLRPVWPDSNTQKMFGDASFSPGAVIVAGSSFMALRAGVYDLIQRMLPPGRDAVRYTAENSPESRAGLVLDKARTFAVNLAPGRYTVRFAAGTATTPDSFATRISLERFAATLRTSGGIKWAETRLDHRGGSLKCKFAPSSKRQACVAAMRIFDRETGAAVFGCYFSRDNRVVLDYEGYYRVDDGTRLGKAAAAADWQEMRAAENESVSPELAYGWLD